MTRKELVTHLSTLSSGTIARAIGSDRYIIIDRAIGNAIIYAAEVAPDAEIEAAEGFAGVLSFLTAHKDEKPRYLP